MGLIRKSLAVSTLGTVSGSSKKQRVAKAQLNELRSISASLNGEPRPVATTFGQMRQQTKAANAATLAARAHNAQIAATAASPTPANVAARAATHQAYVAARAYAERLGATFV